MVIEADRLRFLNQESLGYSVYVMFDVLTMSTNDSKRMMGGFFSTGHWVLRGVDFQGYYEMAISGSLVICFGW